MPGVKCMPITPEEDVRYTVDTPVPFWNYSAPEHNQNPGTEWVPIVNNGVDWGIEGTGIPEIKFRIFDGATKDI